MRFAAVQFDIAWEDKPANHARIENLLDEAEIAPGTFVVLPEMGDTGFSFNLDRIVDERTLDWGRRVARSRSIWLQVGYAVRGDDERGRNCATIISPGGEIVGTYQKIHPFSYGREIEHFSGGDHLLVCEMTEAAFDDHSDAASDDQREEDADHPARRCTVSPLICYDLRFPELWRLSAAAGAEVFTIGANWPAARQRHWRSLLIARAIENQAFIVGVNRTGDDPKIHYEGGSIIVSPNGDVVAEAGNEETILQADLDLPSLRAWRRTFPALADMNDALLGSIRIERTTCSEAGHRGDAEDAETAQQSRV